MPSQKNIQSVAVLVDKLSSSKNFVVVGFDKTPHKKMEALRRLLKEESREGFFEVIKNSLFQVVAKKMQQNELVNKEVLFGPSAIMSLPEDWNQRLGSFFKFAKADESMKFKIGLIDGKIYLAADLEKLASLPSREQLIARLTGIMKNPQRKTVFAMQFPMMRLMNVLKNKKS